MAKRPYRSPKMKTTDPSVSAPPVLLACTGQVNCALINGTCPDPTCVPVGEEATCFDIC